MGVPMGDCSIIGVWVNAADLSTGTREPITVNVVWTHCYRALEQATRWL